MMMSAPGAGIQKLFISTATGWDRMLPIKSASMGAMLKGYLAIIFPVRS
jgi:hypothetical protein